MQTIIIGKRSNLSQHLLGSIEEAVSVSVSEATQYLAQFDWQNHHPVNLILNQFQPATKLGDLSNPIDYINNAIVSSANILHSIESKASNINKIIYTSSSSVYGNNPACKETDAPTPISLYASLKLANEKLVSNFCDQHAIKFTLARVFNMYAGADKFSIVSKIIRAVKQHQTINLINQGGAVRDFIHIEDVTRAYQQILSTNSADKIINIASGRGVSVALILNYLQQQNIQVSTHNITQEEIKTSIANNDRLSKLIGQHQFQLVEDYVLNELQA